MRAQMQPTRAELAEFAWRSRLYYILEDRRPVPVDIETYARWMEEPGNRRVAENAVLPEVRVSTVFLGVDHAMPGEPPRLFETMIFGGPVAEYCWRYSTWEEAEAGHAEAVALCGAAIQQELEEGCPS